MVYFEDMTVNLENNGQKLFTAGDVQGKVLINYCMHEDLTKTCLNNQTASRQNDSSETFPAGTHRQNEVVSPSMQRRNIASTSFRRVKMAL